MSGYCRSITMGRGRRCRPSRNSGFVTSRLYLQRNLRGIYTTSWCAWRCPLKFWKHLKKIQILKKKKFYFEKKTMFPPKNFSQFCLFVWPAIANIYTTYIYFAVGYSTKLNSLTFVLNGSWGHSIRKWEK